MPRPTKTKSALTQDTFRETVLYSRELFSAVECRGHSLVIHFERRADSLCFQQFRFVITRHTSIKW